MINFIRKIRQRLLAEGETGKYLKYAIGEIILVVLGILIALQINNWNESQKNNRLEQNFYADILDDLKSDMNKFDEQTSFYNNRIQNLGWLLEKIRNPQNIIEPDEFGKRVEPLYYANEAISYSATYDASKNSGVFSNFKNKKLLKKITQYYSNFHLISEVTSSTSEIIVDQFEPLMSTIPENYINYESSSYVQTQSNNTNAKFYKFLDSIEDKRIMNIDFRAFLDRPEIENYVIGDLGRSFNSLSIIDQRKSDLKQLVQDIQDYLKD